MYNNNSILTNGLNDSNQDDRYTNVPPNNNGAFKISPLSFSPFSISLHDNLKSKGYNYFGVDRIFEADEDIEQYIQEHWASILSDCIQTDSDNVTSGNIIQGTENLGTDTSRYSDRNIISIATSDIEVIDSPDKAPCFSHPASSMNELPSYMGNVMQSNAFELPVQESSITKLLRQNAANINLTQINNNFHPVNQNLPVTDMQQISFGNFTMKINKVYYNVLPEHYEIEYEFLFARSDEANYSCSIRLTTEQLEHPFSVIKSSVPHAVLYNPRAKNETELSNFISEQLRDLSNVPEIYRYTMMGWTLSPTNKWIFAHDNRKKNESCIEFNTETFLPDIINREHLQNNFSLAFNLFNRVDPLSSTLIFYAFFGILFEPFKLAGYPLNMLLFISGKTGSFKTEISKVLFPSNNKRVSVQKFFSTRASFEATFAKSRSCNVIIDDFYPAVTKSEKNMMNENLEFLVRLAGDGQGKSRSNPYIQQLKQPDPDESIVVTGELTNGSFSSLLRCIIVTSNKQNINQQVLTQLQKNPLLWSSVLSTFVDYIECNFEQIISTIKYSFEVYRNSAKNEYYHARSVSQAAAFYTVKTILQKFFKHYQIDTFDITLEDMISAVETNVALNEIESQNIDPVSIYICSLYKVIELHGNKISTAKDTFLQNHLEYLGFEDDENYYLKYDILYGHIKNYHITQGLPSLPDRNEFYKQLFINDIIYRFKNGSNNGNPNFSYQKKVSDSFGKTLTVVKINKILLSQKFDNLRE